MTRYKVGYFVGSLATKSINRLLAKALVRLAPTALELQEIPFKDLPLYSYDYDANYPPVATAFKNAIVAADAVLFVTPEYNHGPPGSLKNALDFLFKEWCNKSAGFVGYGGTGAARSVDMLRMICSNLELADVRAQIVGMNNYAQTAYMGLLTDLLAWHQADPPDAAEIARNDLIQTFQGNRNPFVDHPEWATRALFESVNPPVCELPDTDSIFADGFE